MKKLIWGMGCLLFICLLLGIKPLAVSATGEQFLTLAEIQSSELDTTSAVSKNIYNISVKAASEFIIPDTLNWTDIQVSKAIVKLDESGYYLMGYNGVSGKAVVIEYDQDGSFVTFHELNEGEEWWATDITNLSDVTVHKSLLSDQAGVSKFTLTKDPLTSMLIFTAQNLALIDSATTYVVGPTASIIVREPLSEGTVKISVDVIDATGNVVETIQLGEVTKTNYAELTNSVNDLRARFMAEHPEYTLVANYVLTNDGVIVLTPQGYYNPGTYLQGNDDIFSIQVARGTYGTGDTIYAGKKILFVGNDLTITDPIVLKDGTTVSYAELLESIQSSSVYAEAVDSYQVEDTDNDGDIDLDDYGRLGWTLQRSAFVTDTGEKIYGLDNWYLCSPKGHVNGDFNNDFESMSYANSAKFSFTATFSYYTTTSSNYMNIYGGLSGVPKGYSAGNQVKFTVEKKEETTDTTQSSTEESISSTSENLPTTEPKTTEGTQMYLPETGTHSSFAFSLIGLFSFTLMVPVLRLKNNLIDKK